MSDDVVTQIAASIAGETDGGRAPAWLTANVPALIEMVRASRPPRRRNPRDMREALNTVERTAGNLTNAPDNPEVMRHLAKADPSVPLSSWVEILVSAPEIAKRAGLALDLVPGGRGKRSDRVGPPALPHRMRCAAIVSEAWQAVRDRREVPNSDGACHAAELLWRASGGASLAEARAVERWRRNFETLAAAEKDHPGEVAIIRAAVTALPPDRIAVETSIEPV